MDSDKSGMTPTEQLILSQKKNHRKVNDQILVDSQKSQFEEEKQSDD